MKDPNHMNGRKPPSRSKGILLDIAYFLLNKPDHETLVRFNSVEERDNFNRRVMQRTGIKPNHYSILNIHKIGVDAPVSYVFNELLQWNGDSSCWPNYIAKVDRIDDDIGKIRILPFGWKKYPLGFLKYVFGTNFIPLFYLNSIRITAVPDSLSSDNARYLLYRCSGGYPIGIFSMYVRSPIHAMNEPDQTQLFLIVGFNFYGKQDWQKRRKWINKIWEMVHNRVTANVLHRIKQLSEWRFEYIQNIDANSLDEENN